MDANRQTLPMVGWSVPLLVIKTLEESLVYRRLASAVTLWKQSGIRFLNEYRAAYTAMDAFIAGLVRGNKWRMFGEGVTVSVITTDGALAYRYRSTIEQVMADTFNYNNNPACSAAVATFNGNVCIAKNGHYTEEEKNIVEAGYNIGSDVKAVKELQSTSRDSDQLLATNNIAKTTKWVLPVDGGWDLASFNDLLPWIEGWDLASFNDWPDILFTTIVSQGVGFGFF